MRSLFYCSILRSSDPDGNKSIELLLERTKNLQQNDVRVKTPVQEPEGKICQRGHCILCEPDRSQWRARAQARYTFFLINTSCKLFLFVREKEKEEEEVVHHLCSEITTPRIVN